MRWRPLADLRGAAAPKLARLRDAERAGLRVPATVWAPAHELLEAESVPRPRPGDAREGALVVRSASVEEDGEATTAAGRFLSLHLAAGADDGEVARASREVARALIDRGAAASGSGGLVFVQERVDALEAGVAFFDGFWLERTSAAGGNVELTSGSARGDVRRGGFVRGDALFEWLARLHARFAPRGEGTIDVEWARDECGLVLLQVRPANFAVRRNPRLSLANHKEILGDPPSPWMASALERAGREALAWFARSDGRLRAFDEPYAILALGRAWLDVSAFLRMMDLWGLPRTFVHEGIGGSGDGPADARFRFGRFVASSPRLLLLQARSLATILGVGRGFRRLDETIAKALAAGGLEPLFDATAQGLAFALRSNFAINGALSGVARLRRALGIHAAARVVTGEMMREYEDLRALVDGERDAGLARWLERWGHRGPLESDLARPRFAELGEVLRADLASSSSSGVQDELRGGRGPLYWLERRRERFRDELMRRWRTLRAAVLAEGEKLVAAGVFERASDAFLLGAEELAAPRLDADLVAAARARAAHHARLRVPDETTLDDLEQVASARELEPRTASTAEGDRAPLRGVGLSRATFEGTVVRADDLVELLARAGRGEVRLDASAILVVPTLEPSWAIVFGRVGAVVSELGGELSHASILLREAGKPALVNCTGAWSRLRDGDRVRIEGARGELRRL